MKLIFCLYFSFTPILYRVLISLSYGQTYCSFTFLFTLLYKLYLFQMLMSVHPVPAYMETARTFIKHTHAIAYLDSQVIRVMLISMNASGIPARTMPRAWMESTILFANVLPCLLVYIVKQLWVKLFVGFLPCLLVYTLKQLWVKLFLGFEYFPPL